MYAVPGRIAMGRKNIAIARKGEKVEQKIMELLAIAYTITWARKYVLRIGARSHGAIAKRVKIFQR